MLDALERWRALLGELAELGDALCRAIEAGDVVAAIATMMQLRRVRSALARVEPPAALRGERAELEAMAELRALMIRGHAAEAASQRWLARPLPGDDRLLASPLGIAVLADASLPAVWDFDSDLILLIGGELDPVAELLADVGQRRIVTLSSSSSASASSPAAIRAGSVGELAAAIRTLVPNPPAQLVVRAGLGADRAEVEAAAEAARGALADLRVHSNTVRAFSRAWIEQGTGNLGALARWPSVAALDGVFARVPMVIVAPGPSLARNVDQLRALRGRAIITAFSHSLKPVLAAGVAPDLVVTVDPQDVRYHFAGCDLSRSCLVNAATVHPSLFELPAPRMLTLSANCAIDDWLFDGLAEQAVVPGGGSVATTAFSLALRWGCDPIVFVGLDLSFPGGAYYVASSSDGRARAELGGDGLIRVGGWSAGFHAMKAVGGPDAVAERAIELPGWHGGSVPSSFMFALFHRWFVERMAEAGDAQVFNCTEGGAFIEGMRHRPLAEVAPLLRSDVDITAALDRAVAGVDPAARTRALARHLGGFVTGLGRCGRLAARARTAIASGDTGRRLVRLERTLAATLAPLEFVSLLAQREIDRADDVARRTGTTGDYLAAQAALLAALGDVVGQLEPTLAAALARLTPEGARDGRAA